MFDYVLMHHRSIAHWATEVMVTITAHGWDFITGISVLLQQQNLRVHSAFSC
jgi:hypothetical protein